MLGKIILSTLVAGLLAGLILAGIQHVRLTPIILAAEVYESPESQAIAEASKPCIETMPGMKMCSDEVRASDGHAHIHEDVKPTETFQRTLSTTVASLLAGIGFAVLLTGISLLSNIPINKQNGLIWGLCGFLAVAVAPAAGIAPELPGMPSAELFARKIWWIGTISATAAGIYLIAIRPESWAKISAILLIAAPHIIGAPLAPISTSNLPATLAAEFVGGSIAAAAIFWSALGLFLGHALERYQKEISEL